MSEDIVAKIDRMIAECTAAGLPPLTAWQRQFLIEALDPARAELAWPPRPGERYAEAKILGHRIGAVITDEAFALMPEQHAASEPEPARGWLSRLRERWGW